MGRQLNLNSGETLENVDFKLTSGGVITGRVTLANGTPLIATRLRLWRVDANERRQSFFLSGVMSAAMTTDDRGVYRLFGLPAGRYVIGVGFDSIDGTTTGNGFTPTYYPDVTAESEAKIIEVKPGSETADMDIRVNPLRRQLFAATLRVVDAHTGTPLPNVALDYGPRRGNYLSFIPANVRQLSNAQGQARMENIPPGRYGANVARYRNDSQPVEFYSEPVWFEIKDGDVEGIEIRAERGIPLNGLAVIEGNANSALLAQLSTMRFNAVSRPQPDRLSSTTEHQFSINRDGTFRIPGLRPGQAHITALMDFGARQWKGFSLLRIEVNGAPITDSFSLSAEAPPKSLKLVFAYGTAVVRGTVKVINGVLPAGVRTTVTAHRTDSPSRISNGLYAEVDARGQFTLEGLAAGEYEVKVNSFWQTPIASFPDKSNDKPNDNVQPKPSVVGPPPFRNFSATQIVSVPATGAAQVALTLDLAPNVPGRNQ